MNPFPPGAAEPPSAADPWREGRRVIVACHGAPGEAASTTNAMNEPSLKCAECGRFVSADESITLGASPVCGECRAVALQRLAAGCVLPCDRIWRRGDVVIMTLDADLGDRCVVCMEPTAERRLEVHVPRALMPKWVDVVLSFTMAGGIFSLFHFPWAMELTMLSALVQISISVIGNARGKRISVPICHAHKQPPRRPGRVASAFYGCAAVSAACAIVWIEAAGLAVVSLISALCVSHRRASPIVNACWFDAKRLSLRGAGEAFLRTLPEGPETGCAPGRHTASAGLPPRSPRPTSA